jgi:hypothetical protein
MLNYLEEITPDVESTVPEGYQGRCKLFYEGRLGESCAVFPNFDEAESAAHAAVNPTVGGYRKSRIEATTDAITHDTVVDWLMD